MGGQISLCDGDDFDESCIILKCVSKGSNGCLIYPPKSLLSKAARLTIKPYGYNGKTLSNVKAFFGEILRRNLCFKVFNSQDGAAFMNYRMEMFAAHTLYDEILGDVLMKSHTTIDNVGSVTGFTCEFKDNFKILRGNGFQDDIPLSEVYIMLQRECQEDLKTRTNKGLQIDYRQLVNDLRPVLSRMHAMGYAHMDIKPDNIVYCPDAEGATYRLIDFESFHRPGNNFHHKSTPQFKSPALDYEGPETNYLALQNEIPHYMIDVFQTFLTNFIEDTVPRDKNHIFIKSDDYAIAQTLNWIHSQLTSKYPDIQSPDELISDLIASEPYFLPGKPHQSKGGKAACRHQRASDKRMVRVAGRTRAVYTLRGRDYVRIADKFVTVASLQRKVRP